MVIFYHDDDDGKCAGFWASLLNQRKTGVKDNETTFVKMNYGWDIPWEKISPGELVYIVDFSFPVEDMDKLREITTEIVWIDHHISAIKKYENYSHHIDGIRLDGTAGCLLTYFYLKHCVGGTNGYESTYLTIHIQQYYQKFAAETSQDRILEILARNNEEPPESTLLVADWDVWKFNYNNTKYFHIGLSMTPHEPYDSVWRLLTFPNRGVVDTADIISRGEIALSYRRCWMSDYCEARGFDAKFKDESLHKYSCYALNIGLISSEDFLIDTSRYDVLVGFSFDGEQYTYSLRTSKDDVNVAEIAEVFGGGGHKAAAGFVSKELCIEKSI